MKRFLLTVLAALLLSGCSSQMKHQKNDDVYEFAKIVAMGQIETVLGYDSESKYSLHKVQGEKEEFPYIYQVTKDDEPVIHIEFEYDVNVHYGGVCFDYGEGYLIPTVKDRYFRLYEPDEYLYSVSLNHEMDYADYQEVHVQHFDEYYHEEVMDLLMDSLSDLEEIEIHDGDLVQLGTPVLIYEVKLNEENKTIEVNQINHFDYPVYINHELKTVFSAVIRKETGTASYGFRSLEEYPLLKENERFIRIAAGTSYRQEFMVTEDGIENDDAVYPLYVDKAMDSIKSIVQNLDDAIEIVAGRIVAISVDESMNSESYKAVENFGTGKIVSEDPLYDPDYNEIGYVYSLNCGGTDGYAITVKNGDSYVVNEASSDTVNPYEGLSKDTIRVYAGPFGYFFYLENGMLMDLRTGEEVDPSNVRRYKFESE